MGARLACCMSAGCSEAIDVSDGCWDSPEATGGRRVAEADEGCPEAADLGMGVCLESSVAKEADLQSHSMPLMQIG